MVKLSINTTFINKPSNDMFSEINKTFENVDVTPIELSKLIKHGYAFCPQLKNNWKKSCNFLCSDYLAIDVDEEIPLEDMKEHEFVKNHGSFIYTTVRHTKEENRYRVVFELDKSITDQNNMKHAMSGLSKKFGSDPSCTDASRMFYGSKGCEIYYFNKTLPDNEVEILINHGKESYKPSESKDTKASEFTSSIVSNITIGLDLRVYDKQGNSYLLKDLPTNTPIRCPIHSPDYNPSAFTVRSKSGTIGVHCMKCKSTYFTKNVIQLYDFNYDLNNLTNLENHQVIYDSEGIPLDITPPSIVRTNQKYLSNHNIDGDIVFVKSPKGSGKTYWLEKIVKEQKAWNKKADFNQYFKEGFVVRKTFCETIVWNGILLISHRRSLITSLSSRLGLKSYINYSSVDHDNKTVTKQTFNDPESFYSICVDSLSTLINPETNKWPIIIIDEVEQVLSHLTSDTLKDRRNNTYIMFKHLLNKAKKVYLMDSDLNELTVESMYQFLINKEKSVSVIINDYKIDDNPFDTNSLDIYSSEQHLKKEMIDSITRNEKCFICSNSKKKTKLLTSIINNKFGDTKKVISITSDNSQDQDIQKFIGNIAEDIMDYDVVLCSPSLGTGLDITFEFNEQHIDCVYGFFESRVNTHFDIDQQISRVRHPKNIRVWISPQTFMFETNADVIKKEIEQSHAKYRHIVNITNEGVKEYNDDEYLHLYANVKSLQRGSKNHLLKNFIKLKKHNGWTVNKIDLNEADVDEIKELEKLSKEEILLSKINDYMSSKLITREEYTTLKFARDSLPITHKHTSAMRRYEIESFYLQDINEDLINEDCDAKLRYQVKNYSLIMTDNPEIEIQDSRDEKKSVPFTDRKSLAHKKKLYMSILITSGLMDDDNKLLLNKSIQNSSMTKFVSFIQSNKQSIERLFDIDIRTDVDIKPIQQLNIFLKQLGIKLDKRTKKRKDGGKDYLYTINPENIKNLEAVSNQRKDGILSEKWHDDRESTTKNRLFNDETRDIYEQIRRHIKNPDVDDFDNFFD